MGPIGTYDAKYGYTLKEIKGSMAIVDVDTNLSYSVPKEAKSDGLPFKIKKAKLNGNTPTEGEAVFDRMRGRCFLSRLPNAGRSGGTRRRVYGTERCGKTSDPDIW